MEEFRGFSNLPLQRLTTSKDVVDNPNFLNYGTCLDEDINKISSPAEEEDWTQREYEIKEQDRWLPLANVGRVMKNALPPNAKLSKESKMCIQECVSEFISFITSGAAEKCYSENRKTLNGEDILYALKTLGFENYAETLRIYLAKYRQHESLDSDERRRKDRLKRQLRKERKEREYRELEEKLAKENHENDSAERSNFVIHDDTDAKDDDDEEEYAESNGYSDTFKDEYGDDSNDELARNYTIVPNQLSYTGFSDVISQPIDDNEDI